MMSLPLIATLRADNIDDTAAAFASATPVASCTSRYAIYGRRYDEGH